MTTPPTTLHDTLRAELDRRLAVARAASWDEWRHNPAKQWHLPEDLPLRRRGEEFVAAGPTDSPTCIAATGPADDPQSMADAAHIALHDPADALRRYTGELEVLERHAPCTDENCSGGDCHRCAEFHPCSELMSLASRLGVSVDG